MRSRLIACLVAICAALAARTAQAGPPPPPPTAIEPDPANYRLVLAGDIVIGLGGASLIVMAVGLGLRADAVSQREGLVSAPNSDPEAIANQDQRISLGTNLAIAGGTSAAALFVSGITLVAVGYARERKRRDALTTLVPIELGIPVPSVGRNHLAVAWALRF